jgi:hypothetical protein
MTKPSLVVAALSLSWLFLGSEANAAGGCGAGLYRDAHGRCHFYQAGAPASHDCAVGFI